MRGVAALLSFLYVAGWVLAAVLAVAAASIELFAGEEARRGFVIGIPATVELADVRLPSIWNGRAGSIAVRSTDAKLEVPFWLAPGSFRAATYVVAAVGYGLLLAFIYLTRALFRSARRGAPFDARNAGRLRWMGALLVGGHVLGTLFGAWQAATVLSTIHERPIPLGLPFQLDERALFSFNEGILLGGLILFALAEIFKHGAALEDEQSLVV